MDGLLIAATPWYLNLSTWGQFLQGALGLGLVIFVHELGHFLAAKACGVKCEKFYVGFDVPIRIGPLKLPRALVRFRWGETEYGIGILPLGGYVKMLGQDDDPRNAQAEAERIRTASGSADEPIQLDPRSYPAKTVPQRMLIISAGVLMNLLFAVIFAAFAYREGLPYTPCEIGNVLGDSPAWRAGLQPGDRILQIGRQGQPNNHLRYDWDLVQGVGLNGADHDLDLLVRRTDGREEWITLRPRLTSSDGHERPTIGILPAMSTKLSAARPTIEYLPAGSAGLKGGDEVVAVNGQPLANYFEFQELAWRLADQPLQLSIRRENETVTVEVPANHRRSVGIVPQGGPIVSVRTGSPAAQAGLAPGDELISLAGEPIGDLSTLPHRLRPWFGQEVDLEVKRARGSSPAETLTVKVRPQPPRTSLVVEESASQGLLSLDALGLTYRVSPIVAAVDADSPAAAAGIQTGDRIKTVRFVAPAGKEQDYAERFGPRINEPLVMDDTREHWLLVETSLQMLPPETKLAVEYEREKVIRTAELQPVATADFLPLRGLGFTAKNELRVAESWGEALSLGARQTREDAFRVGELVKRLVTGRVSIGNLGGPVSILVMATSEASLGKPRLLLFLTFLSANLAVLNFLPIPALDGGHMMFLAWEGIFRRPVNERVQMGLTAFGVVCLLTLMLVVFSLDFWRLAR